MDIVSATRRECARSMMERLCGCEHAVHLREALEVDAVRALGWTKPSSRSETLVKFGVIQDGVLRNSILMAVVTCKRAVFWSHNNVDINIGVVPYMNSFTNSDSFSSLVHSSRNEMEGAQRSLSGFRIEWAPLGRVERLLNIISASWDRKDDHFDG